MKTPGIFTALITAATALPVTIRNGNSPVPEREELIDLLESAPDADTAANLLLGHYQKHQYPAVGVEVEDVKGTRLVRVDVSKYQNIWLGDGPSRTKTAATNHFEQLAGNFVNLGEMKSVLKSFHANPLHRAVPQLQADPDGVSVNALLRIEQSQPHRFSSGFMDSGAAPLPRERFWLQGEFADLRGRNSLNTARLTVSPDPSDFHALQLGSRFFQSDGSELTFSTSYSGAQASTFDAYTWQVGSQWRTPEATWLDWQIRGNFGLSYRRSNNALEFGDATNRGLAGVFQITLGGTMERTGEKSLTRISGNVVLSPFGDDDDHNSLRPGARAGYELIRTSIWHRQDLAKGWDLVTNLAGQWTSAPVLQADQIALGGAAGLRGLPEQFALGDHGILGGLELRAPTWNFPGNWACRPSIFLQAGETRDEVLETGTSAVTSGVGIQIGKNQHLRASLHAGWRLDKGDSEIHSQLTWKF